MNNQSNANKQVKIVANASMSFSGNSSAFNSDLSQVYNSTGYTETAEYYENNVDLSDEINDYLERLAADIARGYLIEGGIYFIPETGGVSAVLVIPGFILILYGNEIDKDPWDLFNWVGVGISLVLSLTPTTNAGKGVLKASYKESVIKILRDPNQKNYVKGYIAGVTVTIDTGISSIINSFVKMIEKIYSDNMGV